jgi:molecular chaperone GrpE
MESGKHVREGALPGNGQCSSEKAGSLELLESEVERLREEMTAERDRGLRTLADFDNYRRRVRRERADAEHSGKRDLLLTLLEVMDDFDRALEHVGEASDAVMDGLRLIHQRLVGVLESNDVTPFESEGRQFDPMMHEAMSVVESDEYQSGTVYMENRRGYFWNGELLRPARVTVMR